MAKWILLIACVLTIAWPLIVGTYEDKEEGGSS